YANRYVESSAFPLSHMLLKSLEEDFLCRIEHPPRQFHRHPYNPIDLRELATVQGESPGIQGGWVEGRFDCPGHDHLFRLERGLAEWNPSPRGNVPSGLLLELPEGGSFVGFPGHDLAF